VDDVAVSGRNKPEMLAAGELYSEACVLGSLA
jgi:hypothetical protein